MNKKDADRANQAHESANGQDNTQSEQGPLTGEENETRDAADGGAGESPSIDSPNGMNADPAEELAREKDKFLRLFADFENYKKRTTRERLELFRTAGQEVIQALLPVLDDFERALNQMRKAGADQWLEGVELISHKFLDVLRQKGLESIEVNVGDAFDSDIHEAVTQVPAPDETLKGKVIDVIETGYRLGDKTIRHPKVVVGQ